MQREASGGRRGQGRLRSAAAGAPPSEYDRALPGQRNKKHKHLIDQAKIQAYMDKRNAQSDEEDDQQRAYGDGCKHGPERCVDCAKRWKVVCEPCLLQRGWCDNCERRRSGRRTTAQKTYTDNHYIVQLEGCVDELEYFKKEVAKLELKNEHLARENAVLRCHSYGNDPNGTNTPVYQPATLYQRASVPATPIYGASQGPSRMQSQPDHPPPAGPMPSAQPSWSSYQHIGGAYDGASSTCPPMPDDFLEEDHTPAAAKRPYIPTDNDAVHFIAGDFPFMNGSS